MTIHPNIKKVLVLPSNLLGDLQVDLIDYQNDPCKDHNGVLMRFLMVVKDHFTKFVWLRPIQRKEAKFVAAELRILFHEVGFPLIFHTDNGTVFINVLVYNLLIKTDPDILLVSGASCTTRHQGSVKVCNRSIKTIIHKELVNANKASKLKSTKPVGWVSALPQVTSAMNDSIGYGQGLITPPYMKTLRCFQIYKYEHIFTTAEQ